MSGRTPRAPRIALLVGFLALTVGVARAHGAPATGYEISIYRATPVGFWLGVGIALVAAVGVATAPYGGAFDALALLLGGGAVLSIVSLPVIRGYHFYGLADGLTHLGWARAISIRAMSPVELIYPASHLIAGSVSALADVEMTRAMLLVIPLFVLLYVLFVTLTVWRLSGSRTGAVAGAFVSFALLPIYNVGTSLMFVPFTFGMLFGAFFLYLLIRYVDSPPARQLPINADDVLVLLAGVALLFLHSQAFLDLLILLGGVVAVQFLYRRAGRSGRITSHRPLHGHFAVLSGLFLAWNVSHGSLRTNLGQIYRSLAGSGAAGAVVQQRGASLAGVGAGLPELFAKLFLVNVVVMLFAVWVVLASLRGSRLTSRDLDAWVVYLIVGGTMFAGFAVLHFFGAVSTYFFRHMGIGMVLVSILGGVGITLAARSIPIGGKLGTPLASLAVLVALGLSIAILFPSPYIYNPSHHVTEAQLSGHETVFEHRADDVEFAAVRGGVERYSSAMPGVPGTAAESIYGEEIRAGLATQFGVDRYLIVTDTDRYREIVAYRGLRVTREDFRSIRHQRSASRIGTNGELDVYYVPSNETAT